MRKFNFATDEEFNYSFYRVHGDYGVVVSTDHGLFETSLPSAGSPDEILANLNNRFARACSGNELTRDAAERLLHYFSGEFVNFDYPIDQRGFSAFQIVVYHAVRAIGYGSVRTYGEIAREIQRPTAARGVGSAMANNPLPIIIPCHRIIGSTGAMTGYSAPGGVRRKENLLHMEAAVLQKLSGTIP
jgi:methylated-DNA-[protein]-cysteine S-methyltransferase